jgi:glycosyltransferase involved in cell wall biosynthesis
MSWPLISVVIPAFNAGRTIDRALASVIAQDYHPLKIIVIDDGSTDNTGERVISRRDERMRLLRLDRNSGEAAAMNEGLKLASGEFVAFLDADDEWLPGKLRTQMPILLATPAMSFVCSRWRQIDQAGRVAEQPDPAHFGPPISVDLWRELLARAFVLKSTVIARTSHLHAAGGFDRSMPVADDQDMWIKLALLGSVGCCPEPLTIYHELPSSLTQLYRTREKDFVMPMVRKHIATQRKRLTPRETRRILGARYAQFGRSLYQSGRYLKGLYYLARAILLGFQPADHLIFIILALPPTRRLKHFVRDAHRSARISSS